MKGFMKMEVVMVEEEGAVVEVGLEEEVVEAFGTGQ